jgi:hypothetical protein
LAAFAACGKDNIADCDKGNKKVPCSARTDDENARIALDDGDFDTAVTLLDDLIAKEPDKYARYPLAAAAHAGRAGISILSLAQSQLASGTGSGSSSGSGSGGGLFDAVGQFLPDPVALGDAAYDARVTDMAAAVAKLNAIPADLRATTSSEAYASSATLQLGLYSAVYSVMYLNKFAVTVATTGALDPDKLNSMTDADASAILGSLTAAAESQAAGNPALQTKVNDALAQIQAQSGSTDKEKLQALLATQTASGGRSPFTFPSSTPPTVPPAAGL